MPFDTAAYVGRDFDLGAFQGFEASGTFPWYQALAQPGDSGVVVAGIELLSQRFLLELLTETGSLVYLPTRGCGFMSDARSGRWRTPADVEQSFHSALLDVKRNLQQEETTSDPLDECYASASLQGVTVASGLVTLSIALLSQAGTSRTVFAPLPLTP